MRALVTGAAGFIGSTLVDRLLADGHEVVGVDCFTPYYDRSTKNLNLSSARENKKFELRIIDLSTDDLGGLLDGISDVYHQAGQPGVRASWGSDFREYVSWNIVGTQRLLEIAKTARELRSFVAASSSSVYGAAETFPTTESMLPAPISPYGVTKLASENLCSLYFREFGLPTVSLRYFTVYGPRQRPDMAISKIINSCIHEREFIMFGDGTQRRDFTYVDDVVRANLLAAHMVREAPQDSRAYNVGGNTPITLNEVISNVERVVGRALTVRKIRRQSGDPQTTGADIQNANVALNWRPEVNFETGIQRQVNFQRSRSLNSFD